MKSLSLHLQVLFARSPTDLASFVEKVEHTAQYGQQQDADDDDCNDDATTLWWRRSTRTTTGFKTNRITTGRRHEAGESGTGRHRAGCAAFHSVKVKW